MDKETRERHFVSPSANPITITPIQGPTVIKPAPKAPTPMSNTIKTFPDFKFKLPDMKSAFSKTKPSEITQPTVASGSRASSRAEQQPQQRAAAPKEDGSFAPDY